MNCPKCGMKIDNDMRRCSCCGDNVENNSGGVLTNKFQYIGINAKNIFKKLLMIVFLIVVVVSGKVIALTVKDFIFGDRLNAKQKQVVDYSNLLYRRSNYSGLSIELPFLLEKQNIDISKFPINNSEEFISYSGKFGELLQVNILHVKYIKGMEVDLNTMAELQVSALEKNNNIIKLKRIDEDVDISGIKCKRVMLDADTKLGKAKVMYNFIKHERLYWCLFIFFDGNNKDNIEIVKRAINTWSLKI